MLEALNSFQCSDKRAEIEIPAGFLPGYYGCATFLFGSSSHFHLQKQVLDLLPAVEELCICPAQHSPNRLSVANPKASVFVIHTSACLRKEKLLFVTTETLKVVSIRTDVTRSHETALAWLICSLICPGCVKVALPSSIAQLKKLSAVKPNSSSAS